MKNLSLCIAGLIFLAIAAAQFLRFHFGIMLIIGNNHHIPLGVSLWGSICAVILALWMFLAASFKNS